MARVSIHERGEYLSDAVFSASDGVVTTFAVVAGSAGASLDPNVVLILGFANLFADGFSMASGIYIGVKSEIEYEKAKGKSKIHEGLPIKHALVTFFAFNSAGLVPLLPFLFKALNPFITSSVLVGLCLFVIGLLRSFYTKKNFVKSGVETFVVGGLAAFIAFLVGSLIKRSLI